MHGDYGSTPHMRERSVAGTCRYQTSCHFYNIAQKNDHSTHLLELYCVKWPEQCLIHQKRKVGAPVPITLWPTGRVN